MNKKLLRKKLKKLTDKIKSYDKKQDELLSQCDRKQNEIDRMFTKKYNKIGTSIDKLDKKAVKIYDILHPYSC